MESMWLNIGFWKITNEDLCDLLMGYIIAHKAIGIKHVSSNVVVVVGGSGGVCVRACVCFVFSIPTIEQFQYASTLLRFSILITLSILSLI